MHGYGWFFFSFWWLIFPLMGFVFGGFGMWMSHRRSQQALDILKTYAEQGKEPPPEVMQAIQGGGVNGPGYGGPGYGPGPYGGYGGPWGGWGARAYRWGPYWAWRRVVIFGSLAAGFGFAAWYGGGETHGPFILVAIIMGCLTVGSLVFAVLNTVFMRNDPTRRP